jgi:pyruvate dehydrogenase E1 component
MPATKSASALPFGLDAERVAAIESIARRALAQTVHMVWEANHREDADPTDPKVGGHPAACASSLHLCAALHLVARQPQDFWCAKPHLAPLDHAFHYLAEVFREEDGSWMDAERSEGVMHRLRKFSKHGEPVFQSYHAASDPDDWRILPSGTVGIPPVNSGYLALTHRYLQDHDMVETGQDLHFWSLLGDSEFREGSLMEAITDFAERGLDEVTWIVDYNRQSLDGTRLPNNDAYDGTDADRIEKTMRANGWEVLHLRHGRLRESLFAMEGGDALRQAFESGLSDYEIQALLWKRDASLLRAMLKKVEPGCAKLLKKVEDDELLDALDDLGGHDLVRVLETFAEARCNGKPTMILAHTLKGWGLTSRAMPGNHSTIPDHDEVAEVLEAQGLSMDAPYDRLGGWAPDGPERTLLEERRDAWRAGLEAVEKTVATRRENFDARLAPTLPLPQSLGLDLSMMPLVHTQWLWGQVVAKLVRIGTDDEYRAAGIDVGRELTEEEARWSVAADMAMTISPDVGTSTNINPTMDGKIYGPVAEKDLETEFALSERGRPQLYSTANPWTRHIRFEIAEAAALSCAGSFGKAGYYFGVPLMPMMTVYDFFIKRALDQLYYNVYWRAGFLLVGTPSGVTLSPEGAQHSWKSDIQMPAMITWEPFFPHEMEWILADAMQRHVTDDNEDRSGVVVRGVTMATRQKEFLKRLKTQQQHAGRSEEEILAAVREDVLAGGYWLVHHEGDADYQPGENVVTLLSMGAPTVEALKASDRLRELGICANVLVVTCADLLLGRFAERDGYTQLKKLGVDGAVHLVGTAGEALDTADLRLLAARTVPIVAIVDGEPGLLDNAGSVIGVRQRTLAVQKFSKSARPDEVFAYHGMDSESIVRAAGQVLAESTLREVRVSAQAAAALATGAALPSGSDWRELWPYDGTS